MKCKFSMDDIINYTEQVLPDNEAEAIREHLGSCKKCRDYYNTLVISESLTREVVHKNANIENKVLETIDKNRYTSNNLLFKMGPFYRYIKPVLTSAAVIAVIFCLAFVAIMANKSKSPVVLSPGQTQSPAVSFLPTPVNGIDAPNNMEKKIITVYFANSNADAVVPEKREAEVKSGDPIEKVIFEELIKGPTGDGLFPVIPKGTRLLSVNTANEICTIDLSKEFVDNSPGGTSSESMTLNSVVNSLTELPNIKKVQFLIEGKKREVYTHAVFNEPLMRIESTIQYPKSSTNVEWTVRNRAGEAVNALRNRDMTKLSELIHPDKGVRFSAYSHATEKDMTFSASQIADIFNSQQKYFWGSYDGSGDPIELTFEEYFKKFVYDRDFAGAPQVGYNKILGTGNTLVNINEFYPGCNFVEYHFPGFDPQYSGMDWVSLRFVLENKSGTWYLVGILHDQWTI